MTSYKKSDAMVQQHDFHLDFKNLVGFALAIWETAKPAPYFEGSKMRSFS